MKQSAAAKKVITASEVESLVLMDQNIAGLKQRLDLLQAAYDKVEQTVLEKVQGGAENCSGHELVIKSTERRNVAWKSQFVAIAGPEAADRVLAACEPSVTLSICIR